MTYFTLTEATAWTETTKVGANFNAINVVLEQQTSNLVLSQLAERFNIANWTDATNTPQIVRTICAMYYVAYMFDKTYSTDDDLSAYAILLRSMADANIAGLLAGHIALIGDAANPVSDGFSSPVFYPTDASSATDPTNDDSSLGPAAFSMGSVF